MITVKQYFFKKDKFIERQRLNSKNDCEGCSFLSKSGKVCFYAGKISYKKGQCQNKEPVAKDQ